MTSRSPVWEFLVPPSAMGDPGRRAVSARGVHVTMADGSRLLCGTSGLWNVNFGYGNPRIADAVHRQLLDASYLTLFRYGNQPAFDAAGALVDACGPTHYGRVIFTTSGSTANDVAIKLSRQWAQLTGQPQRRLVVGLRGSYHGLTYGSGALTGEDLGQDLYGVDMRSVRHVSADDPGELEQLCARHGDRIAALVVEPVLGTGTRPLSPEFVAEAGRLADRHGFLMVADEVATGFYRTGPFVASGEWERPPDVLLLSKGLTNGTCAAAAVVVSTRVCTAFDCADAVFVHGETQAGSPATAAAILATLEVASEAAEAGRPAAVANELDTALGDLVARSMGRITTSGRGCFRAIQIVDDAGSPLAGDGVAQLVSAVRACGAIVHPGPGGVQLIPSLAYADGQACELVARLTDALSALGARAA